MFVICIESSHARGLGHLYRSLTLAGSLRERGLPLYFLLNDHMSSVDLIRAAGYEADVIDLASDAGWEQDWLLAHPDVRVWVNDRLDTSEAHARRVRAMGVCMVTFDDRGAGAALADLHFAALAFEDTPYLRGKRVICGVDYLILDPQLENLRRLRTRQGSVLITMGGSDTWSVTPRIMQALLERGQRATVVLGPAFCHESAVDAVLARSPAGLFTVHRGGVPSLAAEMARHELAITGGGMTPCQANAIGLPCIVIANETFEMPVGRALERLGGSVFAGLHTEIDLSPLDRDLPLAAMSRAGIEAIDLQGCERVSVELGELAKDCA